jgi:hypothetical protein
MMAAGKESLAALRIRARRWAGWEPAQVIAADEQEMETESSSDDEQSSEGKESQQARLVNQGSKFGKSGKCGQ